MRALTLTQPWASAVALGLKRVETRSWGTVYRGALAIHAAKGWHREDREYAFERGFDPGLLPRACVIAIAHLRAVVPTEEAVAVLSEAEIGWGNYEPLRFAWFLEDVEVVEPPVEAKGQLGLWEWKR